MTQLDLFRVRSMWGHNIFDFASSSARGLSGGILSVWDPNVFRKLSVACTRNLVIVEGTWLASGLTCFMVNVYAPQSQVEKQEL